MNGPILVTGGTGTLGRLVVPRLLGPGRDVRVLTRYGRPALSHKSAPGTAPAPAQDGVTHLVGDLVKDQGVDAALEGVHTVLHLAGGPKGDDIAAHTLVRAAEAAGVRHLVFVSVIGAGDVPLGYFRAKHAAERAIAESAVPSTTLRAAQFHDLVLMVLEKTGRLPLVPVPSAMRLEPVETAEVADRLVELALGDPAGRVPDLAGPHVRPMADLTRAYLRARGRKRPLLPFRLPGAAGRAYRTGANLAGEGAERGRRTWESFLADRVG
ncbi:SDR family oxidoreductase [Actinacidiphila guanduensis]|uniref:Uncharacterized conserved protein YbjT, contains NAD(P)-binding and DUF2867 domains n=1 Tax=Actinacidiphila guanduensis TaxID=310781 RepID=A0A1G9VR87_9ACTN|nr:NAD(P)H-binding protein [Actinacidiphila guanduensis]SDM74699.1 Uncharacterized conserved protein YbjT, contains NAD(P)-binding and DUF2867 domains [Actinacidiphila guanduensis]